MTTRQIITSCIGLAWLGLLPSNASAQTNQSGSLSRSEAAPGERQRVTFKSTFLFPGGSPRDFVKALETPFGEVKLDPALVPASANWSEGWQTRLQASEKRMNALRVDWLSIAEIPPELDAARVPVIRMAHSFVALDGELLLSSPTPDDPVTFRTSQVLQNLTAIYNRLAEAKPELGKLVVEGNDKTSPSAIVLARDKSFAPPPLSQLTVKTKAFSLRAIPPNDWSKIESVIGAADLKDTVNALEIAYQTSLFNYGQATNNLALQKSQIQTTVTNAEIQLEFAATALDKYLEGDAPQARRVADLNLKLKLEDLRRAEEKFAYASNLISRGFAPQATMDADRLALDRVKLDIETASNSLRLLTNYDQPKQVRQLELTLQNQQAGLERTKAQSAAQIAQAESNLRTQQRSLELIQAQLREKKAQLERASTNAPRAGTVAIHREIGLLIATGPEWFLDLVESIVTAAGQR